MHRNSRRTTRPNQLEVIPQAADKYDIRRGKKASILLTEASPVPITMADRAQRSTMGAKKAAEKKKQAEEAEAETKKAAEEAGRENDKGKGKKRGVPVEEGESEETDEI